MVSLISLLPVDIYVIPIFHYYKQYCNKQANNNDS
jgi:hypothetical protein